MRQRRVERAPMPHLRWDWRLTPATSAPGLGAHPCHICNGTGLLFGVGIALRLPSQQCRLIRLHRARTMLADRLGHRREVHDRPCARVPHPVVLECEARLQSAQLGAAERNAQRAMCDGVGMCRSRSAARAENARAERSPGGKHVAALRPVPVQMWQHARRHSGSGRAENTGCGLARDGIV